MRYYSVAITKKDGKPYTFASLGSPLTSLLPSGPQNPQNGQTNPAALQIELDIPMANETNPAGNAYMRIWGLGLQDIGNAADLNGFTVAIYAGMAKGLPLANPAQAKLIMQGTIFQAFGNWVNTDQTVDLIFQAGGAASGTMDAPGNFPFVWQPAQSMTSAIGNTLSTALPTLKQDIRISPNLVTNHTVTTHHQTLAAFASSCNDLSIGLLGIDNYDGVQITTDGVTVTVFDGLGAKPTPKPISFQDMIGQPTWIGPQTISLKTVMRGDIRLGDIITLPPSLATQSQQALLSLQDKSTFSGNYLVQLVHHFGNYRQPDAESWNTTFEIVPVPN